MNRSVSSLTGFHGGRGAGHNGFHDGVENKKPFSRYDERDSYYYAPRPIDYYPEPSPRRTYSQQNYNIRNDGFHNGVSHYNEKTVRYGHSSVCTIL